MCIYIYIYYTYAYIYIYIHTYTYMPRGRAAAPGRALPAEPAPTTRSVGASGTIWDLRSSNHKFAN